MEICKRQLKGPKGNGDMQASLKGPKGNGDMQAVTLGWNAPPTGGRQV